MLSRLTRRLLPAIALVVTVAAPGHALKIATYNILNYTSGRTAEFQTVLTELQPDVLVVQEILSQSAVNTFLSTVLDAVEPGEWAAGDFVNGNDTDNAIYYKPAKVQYLSHFVIGTTLRDIDEWTIRPVGYTSSDADLRLYVVHLKASSGGTNEQRRLDEVTDMRARMETFPAGQNYAVLGDFNIYTSAEPAYGYMLGTTGGTAGVVEDPIDEPGNWHNNAAFADIHTQSPRTTQFGGGANGGMDDRFDMILTSPAMNDLEGFSVLPSTYLALGQDGQHFNGSLADPPYVVVPQAIAVAIHDASDHLPVIVDAQVPAILSTDPSLSFGTVIEGAAAEQTLSVGNDADVPGDDLDYTLVAPVGFTAPGGPFSVDAGAPDATHAIGMLTTAAGNLSGDLVIQTDAPDATAATVPLDGTVLAHAEPSLDGGEVALSGEVDFGTHDVGGFSDQPVQVHNFGYGSLQALLDVYDATITGDARFSIVGGFTPASVGGTPAEWQLGFDDAGASDGPYEATLTFSTRDQQDLDGATDRADLVVDLIAVVGAVVDVPASTPVVATGLRAITPNPFRPLTTIAYDLERVEHVRLTVFDVAGRQVRALTDRTQAAGSYRAHWEGRDDAGADVGAGIFYVRLTAGSFQETRVVVRLR